MERAEQQSEKGITLKDKSESETENDFESVTEGGFESETEGYLESHAGVQSEKTAEIEKNATINESISYANQEYPEDDVTWTDDGRWYSASAGMFFDDSSQSWYYDNGNTGYGDDGSVQNSSTQQNGEPRGGEGALLNQQQSSLVQQNGEPWGGEGALLGQQQGSTGYENSEGQGAFPGEQVPAITCEDIYLYQKSPTPEELMECFKQEKQKRLQVKQLQDHTAQMKIRADRVTLARCLPSSARSSR
uniref:Uncharacterized protein n=1 Tax=Ramularia collo-cygni TaxID=112498 RepID=A0A2D3VDE8_9PEZI